MVLTSVGVPHRAKPCQNYPGPSGKIRAVNSCEVPQADINCWLAGLWAYRKILSKPCKPCNFEGIPIWFGSGHPVQESGFLGLKE